MGHRVVIDTNALVSALSSKSVFHWLIKLILTEVIDVFVTDEIVFEYEEVLKRKYSETTATNFILAIKELSNVHFVQVYYRWNILKDSDDNKFVDCYVSANAHYLITNDSGFNVLKSLTFPPVNICTVEAFEELIK